MRTDQFDFELPDDLIALRPATRRDDARLLVVNGDTRYDRHVRDLPNILAPGDALVLNDTRVIPAALEGFRYREHSRAKVSVNLHKRCNKRTWLAFLRPARKLVVGDQIVFGTSASGDASCQPLVATITQKNEGGEFELAFDRSDEALDAAIAQFGVMPLPPYIASRRPADADDRNLYQTIYASRDGAVAAPTAGLHFTDTLFSRLTARGVTRHNLTLHVGAGTFLPVKSDFIRNHEMHAEWGELSSTVASKLNEVRSRGGRIVAVGTTVARLLETAAAPSGEIRPFVGETNIFISPGFLFRGVDALLTNFHLPRSTLFMLVSAFSGLRTMKAAYAHAVSERYRFYSYGDATLLWPTTAQKLGRRE
ncbi:MAG: tRNA preQ1(34) S-adenosylmethionine ribosyltransferase-isomerase QueA [Hyphomicrobiaceae bacterium]